MEVRKKLFIEPYSYFHKIFCTLQIILKLRVKSHFHAIYLYKYKGFVILQVVRKVVWDTSQYVMQCFPHGINPMNIPTVTGFVILQVIRKVVWDTSQYVMQCFPHGINPMNIPTVTSSFFVSKCQAFILGKIMLLTGDFRIYRLKALHNYICSKC